MYVLIGYAMQERVEHDFSKQLAIDNERDILAFILVWSVVVIMVFVKTFLKETFIVNCVLKSY